MRGFGDAQQIGKRPHDVMGIAEIGWQLGRETVDLMQNRDDAAQANLAQLPLVDVLAFGQRLLGERPRYHDILLGAGDIIHRQAT